VSESLTWPAVGAQLERALGEPVRDARLLTPPRPSRMTWAGRTDAAGELVVKVRRGDDRACGKTQWCAAHLPLLGARGYPVPAILWHGRLDDDWHVAVQTRLPGQPLWPLTSLSGPMLESLLRLVELQAGAGLPAGDRDFAGYVANVLFDDWDDVWHDAGAGPGDAAQLCARVRRWLQPAWGLRLPPADYAHNDLNLSNVLTDGRRITGVVDWDEFGLGSRALDLVVLAFDCERIGGQQAADRLLARAAAIVGAHALRCLVSYRALVQLAGSQDPQDPSAGTLAVVISAILDRLGADQA
jgi:aminoglycoside phosphotransferase (APT) family kinase protein